MSRPVYWIAHVMPSFMKYTRPDVDVLLKTRNLDKAIRCLHKEVEDIEYGYLFLYQFYKEENKTKAKQYYGEYDDWNLDRKLVKYHLISGDIDVTLKSKDNQENLIRHAAIGTITNERPVMLRRENPQHVTLLDNADMTNVWPG